VPLFATGPKFYDTNGDFTVSAGDALDVINFVNAGLGGEGEGSAGWQASSAVFGELGAGLARQADDLAVLLSADSPPGKRRGRAR
jgi:hypothetical protein